MEQKKILNNRQIRQQKKTITAMLLALFLGLQIIWGIWAYYNQATEKFLGLILIPFLVGVVAIIAAVHYEANYRLVFYAGTLLTIGQLVQAVIQQGDDYIEYQKSFQGIGLLMTAACLFLIFFLHGFLRKLNSHTRWMTVVTIVLAILTYIMLAMMVVSAPVYGAHIQISIGGRSLQIMEFIKPIAVLVVSGIMYVPNIKWYRIMAAFLYITSVTGVCLVFCNEFGTGCTVFLMGMLIIIIFQNSRISYVFIAMIVLGCVALTGVFLSGRSTYRSTAFAADDSVFAAQYTSCSGTKNELMDFFNRFRKWREREDENRESYIADGKEVYPTLEEMESAIDLEIQKTGIKLAQSFTFEWFEVYYLKDVVQNKFVQTSAFSDKKVEQYEDDPFLERDIDNRAQFMKIMEIIASNQAFRSYYFDLIINKKVYSESAQNAYKATYMNKENVSSIDKVKFFVFKSYCSLVYKFEERLSGVLNSEEENLGAAYQVNMARRAMATGSWFGNSNKVNLQEDIFAADSDMVFAVATSELGCVMGEIIILLNMLIFMEMIMVSLRRRSQYLKAVCAGIAFTWMTQVVFVIAGNCRFFMLTGMTLPFVANGGMSVIDSALMIALLAYLSTGKAAEDIFSAREQVEEKEKNGKKGRKRITRYSEPRRKPDRQKTTNRKRTSEEEMEDYLDFLDEK